MRNLLLTVAVAIFLSSGFAHAGGTKESGEKGGTADINIGVGELQETKSGHRVHTGGKDKKTERKSGKKKSDVDLDDFDSRRSLNIGPLP